MLKRLEDLARREGKNRSEAILKAIGEYVQAHEAGNPQTIISYWQHFEQASEEYRAVPTVLTMEGFDWKTLDTTILRRIRTNITRELPRINARIPPTEVNTT